MTLMNYYPSCHFCPRSRSKSNLLYIDGVVWASWWVFINSWSYYGSSILPTPSSAWSTPFHVSWKLSPNIPSFVPFVIPLHWYLCVMTIIALAIKNDGFQIRSLPQTPSHNWLVLYLVWSPLSIVAAQATTPVPSADSGVIPINSFGLSTLFWSSNGIRKVKPPIPLLLLCTQALHL